MAQDNGALDQVDNDLARIAELLESNKDLNTLWMHPVVTAEDKKQMVRQLFAGQAHPLTLNLLQLLFDKKRGVLVEQVQRGFRDRYNAFKRKASVKVTSAMALEEGQRDALRAQLQQQLAKEIELETVVDPSLIGGMILQIEDQVIDNSLRGRLEALSHSLN